MYVLERPGDRLVDHMEATAFPGLEFTGRTTALEWLFSEAGCLLACARQCEGPTTLRRAADLLLLTKDLAESGADALQYEQAGCLLAGRRPGSRGAACAGEGPHRARLCPYALGPA